MLFVFTRVFAKVFYVFAKLYMVFAKVFFVFAKVICVNFMEMKYFYIWYYIKCDNLTQKYFSIMIYSIQMIRYLNTHELHINHGYSHNLH